MSHTYKAKHCFRCHADVPEEFFEGHMKQHFESNPTCPDCNERMVRVLYQDEEGQWSIYWACGCKPSPEEIIYANMPCGS